MGHWFASVAQLLKRYAPVLLTLFEKYTVILLKFLIYGWFLRVCKHYGLHPFRIPIDLAVLTFLIVVLAAAIESYEERIESEVSEDLVKQIDASTHGRFKREFNREVAEDNTDGIDGARVFMKYGGPTWLRRVGIDAVLVEAFKAGLPNEDIAVVMATVHQESGYNPLAEAVGTTACGLSQFITATGKRYGLEVIDCLNPSKNAATLMRYYTKMMADDRYGKRVSGETPRELIESKLTIYYCAHHDGENFKVCKKATEQKAKINFDVLHAALAALNEASVERDPFQSFMIKVKHVADRWILDPVVDFLQYLSDWFIGLISNQDQKNDSGKKELTS